MAKAKKKEATNDSILKKEFANFSKFLSKYSIFALAIGMILGQTSKDVVSKLVTGIISPAIALIMPSGEFAKWSITVKSSEFLIGAFLDSLIQMLVSMIVIYIAARYFFRKLDLLGLEKDGKKKSTTSDSKGSNKKNSK